MRALSVVMVLVGLGWCALVIAGDYIVEVGGAEGTTFGGSCLLISGNRTASHNASGTVPRRFELSEVSANGISCAIQKKSGAGGLILVIRGTDGRVVAESAAIQPFGIVMAAGR